MQAKVPELAIVPAYGGPKQSQLCKAHDGHVHSHCCAPNTGTVQHLQSFASWPRMPAFRLETQPCAALE